MSATVAGVPYLALISRFVRGHPTGLRSSGDHGEVPDDAYALLDCGDGRRLDRFGSLVTDRPAPGASEPRRAPGRWTGAAIYHPGSGWWSPDGTAVAEDGDPTTIRAAGLTMEVRLAAGGQVGLFPEHLANAAWLMDAIARRRSPGGGRTEPPGILNLFAYTGLATLLAASAGARAVHVDASRPAVAWARRNAELAGLAARPIRWIVDDALAFVRREGRRGRRYAGLILDPPTYGHGGHGGRPAWQFDARITELLDACAGVAEPDAFWLVTTHTPGWDPDRLVATLATATDARPGAIEGIPLRLEAESGAVVRLGSAARFDPRRSERPSWAP